MNRYLEHDGMKRGLKSQDCAKVLKAVDGYIPDNWSKCFKEVTGALQAADYIALAEKHAPYTKAEKQPIYQKLDRSTNEWVTIDKKEFNKLYIENPKRIDTRTYGPTLRSLFNESAPDGFKLSGVGKIETKSRDRNHLERLLETHEPDIESVYWPAGPELQKLQVTFRSKTGSAAAKGRDTLSGIVDATNYKPVGQGASKPVTETGEVKKEFGVELTPKRKAQDVRSDKYLEVCGRGKRHRVADMAITLDLRIPHNMKATKVVDRSPVSVKIGPNVIWIKYNAEKETWEEMLADSGEPIKPEPKAEESKASKIDQSKYPSLRFSGIGQPLCCMLCTRGDCKSLGRAQEEWKKLHAEPEPIKPEQLDPKACRQFVEQLLAFDELEAKREADIEQLLVTLLSHPEIGLLSYVHFVEGYKK